MSPYYPTVIAAPTDGRADPAHSVVKQVAWGIGAALAARESSADTRRAAVYALRDLHDPSALPRLKAAVEDSDETVRHAALLALLSAGDDAALAIAEATLLGPVLPIPSEETQDLCAEIDGGAWRASAIPAL